MVREMLHPKTNVCKIKLVHLIGLGDKLLLVGWGGEDVTFEYKTILFHGQI